MPIPFEVPAQFFLAEKLGQVVRYGAILKDSETGRIVAHMQETGLLSNLASLPANAFLSPVSTISSLASNYQLYRVDQKVTEMGAMLGALQTMQIANLALAGLGIGISVAGFAMIKKRIDKVSVKIDDLGALVRREFEEQRLRELERLEDDLNGQLDHAEEGWISSDSTRIWTRVADKLNDMVYSYPRLIERTLRAETPDLALLGYLSERYRVLAATRVECLMLTGELQAARDFAKGFARKNAELFDGISAIEIARARAAGQADRLAREAALRRELVPARAYVGAVREFQDLSATRPLLIETLIERGIRGRDYVEELRDKTAEPLVLLRPG